MPKKNLRIFGYVITALIPTILLLIDYLPFMQNSNAIVFYLLSFIIMVLIAWKFPKGLFVLSVGFLVSSIAAPIILSLLGIKFWFLFNTLSLGSVAFLFALFYAVPFAIASFITALLRYPYHVPPPKIDEPEIKKDESKK